MAAERCCYNEECRNSCYSKLFGGERGRWGGHPLLFHGVSWPHKQQFESLADGQVSRDSQLLQTRAFHSQTASYRAGQIRGIADIYMCIYRTASTPGQVAQIPDVLLTLPAASVAWRCRATRIYELEQPLLAAMKKNVRRNKDPRRISHPGRSSFQLMK